MPPKRRAHHLEPSGVVCYLFRLLFCKSAYLLRPATIIPFLNSSLVVGFFGWNRMSHDTVFTDFFQYFRFLKRHVQKTHSTKRHRRNAAFVGISASLQLSVSSWNLQKALILEATSEKEKKKICFQACFRTVWQFESGCPAQEELEQGKKRKNCNRKTHWQGWNCSKV